MSFPIRRDVRELRAERALVANALGNPYANPLLNAAAIPGMQLGTSGASVAVGADRPFGCAAPCNPCPCPGFLPPPFPIIPPILPPVDPIPGPPGPPGISAAVSAIFDNVVGTGAVQFPLSQVLQSVNVNRDEFRDGEFVRELSVRDEFRDFRDRERGLLRPVIQIVNNQVQFDRTGLYQLDLSFDVARTSAELTPSPFNVNFNATSGSISLTRPSFSQFAPPNLGVPDNRRISIPNLVRVNGTGVNVHTQATLSISADTLGRELSFTNGILTVYRVGN